MPVFPPDLSADEIARIQPLCYDPPPTGTFEVGLALGGTVSAGAYTAGVLDFIVEALETWEKAKSDLNRKIPRHNVIIRNIAGASGGGINGILLGRAIGYGFPHGAVYENPLYRAWSGVDIFDLLQPSPAADGLRSILNTTAIEQTAGTMCDWSNSFPSPPRRYFSDHLRISTTLGNVTGFPYRIQMGGETELSHCMKTLGDWVRFCVSVPTGTTDPLRQWGPDEIALDPGKPGDPNWAPASAACLATSAFPGAFPARQIDRLLSFASYRFFPIPGAGSAPTEVKQLIPDWQTLFQGAMPGRFSTLNVDGGSANNEPIDLVHVGLAGISGRNPRDKTSANRAVLLVDPFTDNDERGITTGNVLDVLLNLVTGLVSQARFKPADLALAHDPRCFSRFLVAPVGPRTGALSRSGSIAIASGSLGGFGGFFSKTFLDHDFKLGRANAYSFLKRHFMLDMNNSLFQGGRWPANGGEVSDWQQQDDTGTYRAIIPVMPEVEQPEMPQELPQISSAELTTIHGAIAARVDWLYGALKTEIFETDNWLTKAFAGGYIDAGWNAAGRSAALSALEEKVDNGLALWGLVAGLKPDENG